MNKLFCLFFISIFYLLANTFYVFAESSGLFSGYRLEVKNSQKKERDIKFKFSRNPQQIEEEKEIYYEEDSTPDNSSLPNASSKKIYHSESFSNKDEALSKPDIRSRRIFTSQPSTNQLINDFNYYDKTENKKITSDNEVLDSGIPVNFDENDTSASSSSSPYRNQQKKTTNNQPKNIDITDYQSKLPQNYLSNHANTNMNKIRQLSKKKPIKYPHFLLFANDVVCTTQAGIKDGMIFYTPHGTYKLKGNLLVSTNNTYLISGNRVWLDNMIYYFDDSGVYLNNKIYNFKNNVMYRNGVKYLIEGTVISTSGIQGNHTCIVSELVE